MSIKIYKSGSYQLIKGIVETGSDYLQLASGSRLICKTVKKITDVAPTVSLPSGYLTLDTNDTYGMLYPPSPPVSRIMMGSIVNAKAINSTTREINITVNLSISFYDYQNEYMEVWAMFVAEGCPIYIKFGSNSWQLVRIPFSETRSGSGEVTLSHILTQTEWNNYTGALSESISYIAGNYAWQFYDYTANPNITPNFYEPSLTLSELNQIFPSGPAMLNKIAGEVLTTELYKIWKATGDQRYWTDETANPNYTVSAYSGSDFPGPEYLPLASSLAVGTIGMVYDDTYYFQLFYRVVDGASVIVTGTSANLPNVNNYSVGTIARVTSTSGTVSYYMVSQASREISAYYKCVQV